MKTQFQAIKSPINNDNNNSEFYLHDYDNTALQKRRKHDNYSNLVISVQLEH